MPHYKDKQNKVHFLDDASMAEKYLPSGSVEITDVEASVLTAPVVTQAVLDAQANAAADRTIAAMLPEAVETLMVWAEKQANGQDKVALQTMLGKIAAERAKKK